MHSNVTNRIFRIIFNFFCFSFAGELINTVFLPMMVCIRFFYSVAIKSTVKVIPGKVISIKYSLFCAIATITIEDMRIAYDANVCINLTC